MPGEAYPGGRRSPGKCDPGGRRSPGKGDPMGGDPRGGNEARSRGGPTNPRWNIPGGRRSRGAAPNHGGTIPAGAIPGIDPGAGGTSREDAGPWETSREGTMPRRSSPEGKGALTVPTRGIPAPGKPHSRSQVTLDVVEVVDAQSPAVFKARLDGALSRSLVPRSTHIVLPSI